MIRLAMWSGPRNISTAMMRSWGNRDDCVVVDEPLYAHFLHVTRKSHPGLDEVIATGETDWKKVVAELTQGRASNPISEAEAGSASVPHGVRGLPSPIFFQKHMTHHLLPHIGREWLGQLTNCFLIRHPREVLASYTKVIETPALDDLGFPQQTEIFESVQKTTGRVPAVVDAADVLKDPRRVLGLICDAVGVKFQEAMLSWPPGPRSTDGIWAKYWYGEVEKSNGFRPYQPKVIELPKRLEGLFDQCLSHYEKLYAHRLQ